MESIEPRDLPAPRRSPSDPTEFPANDDPSFVCDPVLDFGSLALVSLKLAMPVAFKVLSIMISYCSLCPFSSMRDRTPAFQIGLGLPSPEGQVLPHSRMDPHLKLSKPARQVASDYQRSPPPVGLRHGTVLINGLLKESKRGLFWQEY